MIRIYYDPQTGVISQAIDVAFAPPLKTYIDSDQDDIKVNEWRINVETKELEYLGPAEPAPTRGM